MGLLEPKDLVFEFSMRRLGPEALRDIPEEYAHHWRVKITGRQLDEDFDEVDEVTVGDAEAYVIPDAAGQRDLFLTLDAHSQDLADVGEMLQIIRPDLLEALAESWGRDLLYVSYIELDRAHRGRGLGKAVLEGILDGVGRYVGLVVLEAAPLPGDDAAEEGSLLHRSAKRSLARYWSAAGFEKADGDWMYQLV
ncbi:hypothetical protein [Sinomonas terrae]|uniref:GNAT family N-acetyltransferase n=1 Tax=Sinomonas terrae TaxID=2908838 RepID=A0ABS9U748_9MICC|nr:hypothetical protein [Sinomonas terrae]MCH6472523.1 hypothetical protein [Sinomonas terrae]